MSAEDFCLSVLFSSSKFVCSIFDRLNFVFVLCLVGLLWILLCYTIGLYSFLYDISYLLRLILWR